MKRFSWPFGLCLLSLLAACGTDDRQTIRIDFSQGTQGWITGSVWLFVGTDSGFEATTSVYYTWVVATFEPI